MSRILIAILVLFVTASAASQAAPAYRTVVLSKGNIKYQLKPDDREQYAMSCPSDICTCNSDVEYVRLTARTNLSALNAINRQLRLDAAAIRCRYLDATDSVHQDVTHVSPRFVSVVEHLWSQQLNTGGSCHGSSHVHTFDLSNGKEYLLGDIISPSSLGRLRSSLPASIVAERNRQEAKQLYEQFKASIPHDWPASTLEDYKPYIPSADDIKRDIELARRATELLDDGYLLASPFLIENSHVFIDIGGYYLGCAGGSFHPAEVPISLITLSAIRDEMAVGGNR